MGDMPEGQFRNLPEGTEIAIEVQRARLSYTGRFRICGPPMGMNGKRPCVEIMSFADGTNRDGEARLVWHGEVMSLWSEVQEKRRQQQEAHQRNEACANDLHRLFERLGLPLEATSSANGVYLTVTRPDLLHTAVTKALRSLE